MQHCNSNISRLPSNNPNISGFIPLGLKHYILTFFSVSKFLHIKLLIQFLYSKPFIQFFQSFFVPIPISTLQSLYTPKPLPNKCKHI